MVEGVHKPASELCPIIKPWPFRVAATFPLTPNELAYDIIVFLTVQIEERSLSKKDQFYLWRGSLCCPSAIAQSSFLIYREKGAFTS